VARIKQSIFPPRTTLDPYKLDALFELGEAFLEVFNVLEVFGQAWVLRTNRKIRKDHHCISIAREYHVAMELKASCDILLDFHNIASVGSVVKYSGRRHGFTWETDPAKRTRQSSTAITTPLVLVFRVVH
jgi:hypothetical protein